MTTRIHIRIATAIAVVATAALTASVAAAGGKPSSSIHYSEPGSTGYVAIHVSIPPRLANFREPGSVGWVPAPTKVTIPAWLTNFREPGSVGWVPGSGAAATAASAGLHWESALIGGGVVLGFGLVCAGALLAIRRRGAPAHA
jgi:hypothetical protein